VFGCWYVPSYVAVRQGALKLSRDALSWELPHGGRDCSFRDAWLLLGVVCVFLSMPECLTSLPHPSLSLGPCAS
jgi:hypothetical protein